MGDGLSSNQSKTDRTFVSWTLIIWAPKSDERAQARARGEGVQSGATQ